MRKGALGTLKKYLSEYLKLIDNILSSKPENTDIGRLKSEHLTKISFMQHERLVHFLVTMLVGLVLIISICAYVIEGSLLLLPLTVIVLCLFVPYIAHYYFLENSVQRMYTQYDDICKWEEERKND